MLAYTMQSAGSIFPCKNNEIELICPHFSTMGTLDKSQNETSLSAVSRWMLVGISMLILLLLISAGGLEPDSRGWGTHVQLGLASCMFQEWTGELCPTCGMTTAWAHAGHGQFVSAMRVHLIGTLLWLGVVGAIPWLLCTAVKGHWVVVEPHGKTILLISTALLIVLVGEWLWRLALH